MLAFLVFGSILLCSACELLVGLKAGLELPRTFLGVLLAPNSILSASGAPSDA